jgi:hypothetical protein
MNDLDRILSILSDALSSGALAEVEGPVMAGLVRLREARSARRSLVMAGCFAALVGSVTALVPSGPAVAEPLLGIPASAPSQLLAD